VLQFDMLRLNVQDNVGLIANFGNVSIKHLKTV